VTGTVLIVNDVVGILPLPPPLLPLDDGPYFSSSVGATAAATTLTSHVWVLSIIFEI